MYKALTCLGIFCMLAGTLYSQNAGDDTQKLFEELRIKDSLIFDLGFNTCDTVILRSLLSDDFEFYHDQNGLLESKEVFIQNIPNLCKMNYRPIRELVENSLEVFPLFSNGTLYGAIQNGTHEFYGKEEDKERYLTSTATFTHVWVMEKGDWKLKRVLSYNHVVPSRSGEK